MENVMAEASIKSPSYPSASLEDAITGVRAIEAEYRGTPVDREEAAKILGYSGLNGAANKALSALSGYGLVERAGKGMMRVTPLSQNILHGLTDAEKNEALREAANFPPLFQKIRDHFSGVDVPPVGGVENLLNRFGFNKNAVTPAAKAFLETARFVAELEESESDSTDEESDVEKPQNDPPAGSADDVVSKKKRELQPNMKEDICTLPEGDVVMQWPDTLSPDSYEDLKDWTELMLRKIARRVSKTDE
ncbi:hypothetical protein [Celeribacter baekdonensis]|uniref:hypothetical protein n=1 Tax=Celeribacter baekdonensis TaxID=875171 RepID=UPI0030D9725E|tara:strand:+ start:2654 stop:3400 length:747 start_codon:yes stop_codon:yes gene_type:complete